MTIQRELLAACWTWAGDVGPGSADERSPIDLSTRIAAVSAAGWQGVGLSHADVVDYRERYGLSRVRGLLNDAGIERVELEFLTDWWAGGSRRTAADRVRDDLLDAAAPLGVDVIKIGALAPADTETRPENDRFAEALHELADRAETFGVSVALEPLGGSYLDTTVEALQVVHAAGHAHAALVLDVYHLACAGENNEATRSTLLEADPPLMLVELGDATVAPDGTVGPRCLPGVGDLDVAGFVAQVWRHGWRGYWGVEIISADLRVLPITEGVDTVRQGILTMIDSAEKLLATQVQS